MKESSIRPRADFANTPLPSLAVADFKSHITGSTMVGVGYGYWGVTTQGMSLESGMLAAGLCAVSGMLPDLDSDSGIPLRETSMFVSAIAPMLMIDRFRDLGMSHEAMALAAMLVYLTIRFVLVEFFRRYTVHRGMWHSIPAALVAGMLAYLIMPSPSESIRVYKSMAVLTGFLVHLTMDEIWSIDIRHGFRLKKSFGTALKFMGNNSLSNFSLYAILALLMYMAWSDHGIVDRIRTRSRLDNTYIAQPYHPTFDLKKFMPWH
jgi:membrane-bound metal-dependent hydrolase YbcI (DUF457 family)